MRQKHLKEPKKKRELKQPRIERDKKSLQAKKRKQLKTRLLQSIRLLRPYKLSWKRLLTKRIIRLLMLGLEPPRIRLRHSIHKRRMPKHSLKELSQKLLPISLKKRRRQRQKKLRPQRHGSKPTTTLLLKPKH